MYVTLIFCRDISGFYRHVFLVVEDFENTTHLRFTGFGVSELEPFSVWDGVGV